MGYLKEGPPAAVVGTATVYAKDGIEDYVHLELLEDGFVRWRLYTPEEEAADLGITEEELVRLKEMNARVERDGS